MGHSTRRASAPRGPTMCSYFCTATYATATKKVSVTQTSGTAFVLTVEGAAAHTINYVCVGN